MSKTVCGSCGAVESVAIDEKGLMPGFGQTGEVVGSGMQELSGDTPGQSNEPDGAGFIKKRKKAKKRRLVTLGAWDAIIPEGKKSLAEDDDYDVDAYLCGADRKVYTGSDGPCAGCAGGCSSEKGLPSLLEVEGLAEGDFGMKILDSGYGAQADLYIVQMERKDGRVVEAMYDGSTAELQGWALLSDELVSEKSIEGVSKVITTDEASDIALKTVQGEVTGVAADQFEGQDAWVVEMTNSEGAPVDVYVGLDGTTLGYDTYDVGLKSADKEEDEEDVVDSVAGDNIEDVIEDEEEDEEEDEDKKEEKTLDAGSLLRDLAELDILALEI